MTPALTPLLLFGTHPMDKPALVLAIVGLLLLGIAWLLLAIARHADHSNWIMHKAPLLPLKLINVRDDVWLEGATRCDAPLTVPHFGDPAITYDYRLEERITEVTTDAKGRRRKRTRWVTREHHADATDFELVQGERSIRVHASEADLHDLPRLGPDLEGFRNWRHSADYLPYPGAVSVLGSVGEHRAWLEKHANIPLVITTKTRKAFLRSSETAESILRWVGFCLQPLGFGALAYAGLLRLDIPRVATETWSQPHALLAAVLGLLAFLLTWSLYSFNSMILYRNRTRTAWKQIDVDLKNRYDLIPRLCEVISGATTHEQNLLRQLTALRSELTGASAEHQIRQEGQVAGQVKRLIAVREAYPELTSNPLFQRLHRELTAIEEKIAHARAFFDDCATEYNTLISQMPRALLARLCGFEDWPLFRVQERQAGAPKVSLGGSAT